MIVLVAIAFIKCNRSSLNTPRSCSSAVFGSTDASYPKEFEGVMGDILKNVVGCHWPLSALLVFWLGTNHWEAKISGI